MNVVVTRLIRYSIAAALCAFTLRPTAALARQESSEVHVEAESGEEMVVDGVSRIVLLDVKLVQGATTIFANRMIEEAQSTYQYLLSGNVRIIEEGDTVFADVVRYDEDEKIGRASGNVLMTDGSSTLRAISAVYHSEEKRAEFDEGVQYEDSTTALLSDRGSYFSDASVADFAGRVRLRQEDLYLEADSINYRRDDEIMQAFGSVFVDRYEGSVDSTSADRSRWFGPDGELLEFALEEDRSLLYSDELFYDGAVDSSFVRGNVFLARMQRREAEVDSLMMRAMAMRLVRDELLDRVVATDSVAVWERSFSVTGDSLVYDRRTVDDVEQMNSVIFGRPRAWTENSQITSDTLRIFGVEGSIDSLRAVGDVFVASLDSVLERIQQIKGEQMSANFRNDSLRTMLFTADAEALYYFEPGGEEGVVAMHTATDLIFIRFRDGTVEYVRHGAVQGDLYRNEIIDQAQPLAGYIWEPGERPTRRAMQAELHRRQRLRAARRSSEIVPLDS